MSLLRILLPACIAVSSAAAVAETVPVPRFDSVRLLGGGTVTVRPGPVQRVNVLEGDARITDFRVEENGQLEIRMCENRCPRGYRLHVEIVTPAIEGLAITGGGRIHTGGNFGARERLGLAISGGGTIDARGHVARYVSAAINGGGSILTRPFAELSAAVNGGGTITYWGNPRVSSAVRGGGSVNRSRSD